MKVKKTPFITKNMKEIKEGISIIKSVSQYKTQTADCGLGIKHGLGTKRGLENTDWV